MRISTAGQLVCLISTKTWKFTGERPSTFGLMRDFEADDGSLVIMIESKPHKTAIAWNGPSICPICEIELSDTMFPMILDELTTNSRTSLTAGQKIKRSQTIFKIEDQGQLASTSLSINDKTFLVETLSKRIEVGTHQWQHRTIGTGLYHDWGKAKTGSKDDCNRSHKEYLESMMTIILRAAQ